MLGALRDPLQGRGPAELGGRCDAWLRSGTGSLTVASEKERRRWKDFGCVYIAEALFLDFSYSGLEFYIFQKSPETQN